MRLIILIWTIILLTSSNSINRNIDQQIIYEDNHQEPLISEENHSHYHSPASKQFWINAGLALILICLGGFCSGMTVGMMSIEKLQLQILAINGSELQKEMAKRILDVVSNHHLFLVTLLIANAIALESLPIVIHTLVPAWIAILISTFVVLLVAQIFPMAYCTGPNKITIAYHAAPTIKVMILIFWVIAYPLSKGLDYLLGVHEHERIQHKDFANFIKEQTQILKKSQILLLTSILQLRCQRVTDIMVPIQKLYLLSWNQKLTKEKIRQILAQKFSYIPVYKQTKDNIVAVVKVKQFAIKYLKGGSKPCPVRDICKENNKVLSVYADTNILQMLMLFQANSHRIALVSSKKKKTLPNMQSIMYSKTDMVMNQREGSILGMVFLFSIFDQITRSNKTMESQKTVKNPKQIQQMTQIKRPLLQAE